MVAVNVVIRCPKICGPHRSQYFVKRTSSTRVAINPIYSNFAILLNARKKKYRYNIAALFTPINSLFKFTSLEYLSPENGLRTAQEANNLHT